MTPSSGKQTAPLPKFLALDFGVILRAVRLPNLMEKSLATRSNPDFGIVRRNKVYEEVARQIERLILKKLKPGDKLPAERELAEVLKVSRGSIRDAIRSLELLGLVEARQGTGTIVREIGGDSSANPFAGVLKRRQEAVRELLDFRKMLEPPLAARAATHASPEEIAELGSILKRRKKSEIRERRPS